MSMQVTTAFITPPAGLVTPVNNPQTQKPGYAFPLQTAAWLQLQVVVKQAMSFPFDKDTFVEKYGSFTDEAIVESAVAILHTIKATSDQYGDPSSLISNIGAFQQADAAPKSIYGNAVWLAYKTQTTAQQIVSLLNEGLQFIGEETDPAKRLADLTDLLTGQGGITDQADDIKQEIAAFSDKLANFYTTLDAELNTSPNSLKNYLDQSDNVLAVAKQDVKDDDKAIERMKKLVDKLNSEYIGFTTAASLSPLFLLIPIFGMFLAAADATTFGILAGKTKAALDEEREKLESKEEDEAKKTNLVTQLGSFNTSSVDVKKDGDAFLETIEKMEAGWTELSVQVKARLASLTEEDLKDWSAFLQRVNFKVAVDGWGTIANKAEDFAMAGFISFKESPE